MQPFEFAVNFNSIKAVIDWRKRIKRNVSYFSEIWPSFDELFLLFVSGLKQEYELGLQYRYCDATHGLGKLVLHADENKIAQVYREF